MTAGGTDHWQGSQDTRIGDYELVDRLAIGSYGAVFRAVDADGREVALKLLHDPRPRARERFARETQALIRLRHPHIVPALDAGEDRGRSYLVLELVEGQSLAQRLRNGGPLPAHEVAEIGRKLARALQHVHENELLHRDVKPENVLLDLDGEPRLTDFGLAWDADSAEISARLTQGGACIGTPGYWPPELAEGVLDEVGPCSDVYSLGATLWALLVGHAPLLGPNLAETIKLTVKTRPEPPSAHRPEVPPALDAVVLRCLEKDPARRFGSMAELEQALAGVVVAPRRGVGLLLLFPVMLLAALAAVWGLGPSGEVEPARKAPELPGPAPDPPPPPAAVAEPASAVQPAAPPPSDPEVDRLVEQAIAALGSERHAEALAALDQALGRAPGRGDALVCRARARAGLGELPGMLADVDRALEVEPALRYVHGWRWYAMSGQLAVIGQALELQDPPDPAAHLRRGWLRLLRGDQVGAGEDARAATGSGTESGEALLLLASAARARDPHAALDLANLALAERPEDRHALHLRARILYEMTLYKDALVDAELAARLHPDDAHLHLDLAEVRLALADVTGAMAALDRSHALDPRERRVLVLRSGLLWREGRDARERALADMRELVRLAPDDGACRLDLADALVDEPAGVVEAGQLLAGVRGPMGESARFFHVHGQWERARGELELAEGDYARAVALDPRSGSAWLELGLVRGLLGRREEACAAIEEAVNRLGDRSYAAMFLAALGGDRRRLSSRREGDEWSAWVARHLLGEVTEEELLARMELGDADQVQEQRCEGWCYLGILAEGRGDLDRAARCYRASLETGVTGFMEWRWSLDRMRLLEAGR